MKKISGRKLHEISFVNKYSHCLVKKYSCWRFCSNYLIGKARSVSSTCPDDEPHLLVR